MLSQTQWSSRKFRLMVFDAVAGVLVLAVGQFVPPETADFLLEVWKYMQPVAFAVIVGIAAEDAAEKNSGALGNRDPGA